MYLHGFLVILASLSAAPQEAVWEQVTEHAAFSPRDTAKPVVFGGKMFLGNGYYHGAKLSRDLWASADGKQWTPINDATPYDGYSELMGYQDRLWAVKQSVWQSADGKRWTRICEKTPFGTAGKVAVRDGRMWVLAANATLWQSRDGANWTCVCAAPPFAGRSNGLFLVFGDRFWLIGGRTSKANDPPEKGYPKMTTHNDVWSSADGTHWTQVVDHAPWSPRMWLGGEVYADRMWVIGGYDNLHHANLGDVWASANGRDWERFPSPPGLSPRHEPSCFVYQGSLWLVAGNSWPVRNDVWRLTLVGTK